MAGCYCVAAITAEIGEGAFRCPSRGARIPASTGRARAQYNGGMRVLRSLGSFPFLLVSAIAFAQAIPCLPSAAEYRRAVLDRAKAISGDIAKDRKAFVAERGAIEKIFGQKPKPTLEILGNGNGKYVGPILDAARRAGIDPEFLTAAMVQEGLDGIILNYQPDSPIDGFGALGVDGFATDMAMLKKKGFLRKDFDGVTLTNTGWVDAKGNSGTEYWRNEAGQVYRAFEFKNLEAAAEGMAAYLKYKQSLFLRDAAKLGVAVASMTPMELAGWAYLYYNAGEGTGYKVLSRLAAKNAGKIPKYGKGQGAAVQFANRVMASIQQYRNRNLFPDPASLIKCPEPAAGSNVARNAQTQGGVTGEGADQGAGTPR